MRLIHFSSKPLERVYSVRQSDTHEWAMMGKPRGLWVSPWGEDGWFQWCHSERFGLETLNYATEVFLMPGARILHIDTPEGIDKLTTDYGKDLLRANLEYEDGFIKKRFQPSWEAIAEEYQGIIISPYQWSRRLSLREDRVDTSWYYGWDCASGCIWDANAVSVLVPFKVPVGG